MNLSQQIAGQLREVLLDGNWISTNFKAQITDVDWRTANQRVGELNTIALLVFHIDYYLGGVARALEGGTLDIRDKYSFDLSPIRSEEDWDALRNRFYRNAERMVELIEALPEAELKAHFIDGKYGSNYRNLTGLIEHAYYHLGQVVLIKKMLHTLT